jgi:hypothetical protein
LCRFNSAVFARKHPCVSRLVFGNPVTDDILLSVLEVMGGEGGWGGQGEGGRQINPPPQNQGQVSCIDGPLTRLHWAAKTPYLCDSLNHGVLCTVLYSSILYTYHLNA